MNNINTRAKYKEEIIPAMKKQFKLSNDREVPQIKKVVVNVGIGKFLKDSSQIDNISKSLATITGQKPAISQAKKSIAGFKIRAGQPVGLKVTLRGQRMWDFIEKLIKVDLPRVRDFHGIKPSAVDTGGNLNLGIKEHLIFPEILPEEVKNVFSLEITLVTNARDKEKGMVLFKLLGFPIKDKK